MHNTLQVVDLSKDYCDTNLEPGDAIKISVRNGAFFNATFHRVHPSGNSICFYVDGRGEFREAFYETRIIHLDLKTGDEK